MILFTMIPSSDDSRRGGALLDLGESENKGRSQQSQMQIQMEQEQEMQALQERESQIRQLEASVRPLSLSKYVYSYVNLCVLFIKCEYAWGGNKKKLSSLKMYWLNASSQSRIHKFIYLFDFVDKLFVEEL